MSPTPPEQPNYTTQVESIRLKKIKNFPAAGSQAAKSVTNAFKASSCKKTANLGLPRSGEDCLGHLATSAPCPTIGWDGPPSIPVRRCYPIIGKTGTDHQPFFFDEQSSRKCAFSTLTCHCPQAKCRRELYFERLKAIQTPPYRCDSGHFNPCRQQKWSECFHRRPCFHRLQVFWFYACGGRPAMARSCVSNRRNARSDRVPIVLCDCELST